LARHFLDRARESGLPAKSLDQSAVDALRRYRWPGNVRELENVMRRLAALTPQEVIGAETVNGELLQTTPPPAATGPASADDEQLAPAVERHLKRLLAGSADGMPTRDIYDHVLAEVERPLIRMTLLATRGNQIKAAAILGLNRNTLRKKIRDLDIPVVRGVG
jgi:two-component system nitrogen regulation response regulator GlnG